MMSTPPETWAGPRRAAWGSNTMVTALHNNVLQPLAQYGGYDLFCLEHGAVRLADGTLAPGHTPGAFDLLRSDSVDAYGRPNRLFTRISELSGDINYSSTGGPGGYRWRSFFYAARDFKHKAGVAQSIRNMLIMNYFFFESNRWVNEHSKKSGVEYRYKLRMRPDALVLLPIPPPHTLEPELQQRVVFVPDHWYCPNPFDKFAFGLTEHMDLYGEHYLLFHSQPGDDVDMRFGSLRMTEGAGCPPSNSTQSGPPPGCGQLPYYWTWTTEWALNTSMWLFGRIHMNYDPRFRISVIRTANFSRLVQARVAGAPARAAAGGRGDEEQEDDQPERQLSTDTRT